LELIAEPKNVAIHNDNGVTAARMIESFNAAAPALYDPLTRERGAPARVSVEPVICLA
jgi:hypothetical protein